MDIIQDSWVSFITADEISVRVTLQGLVSHEFTAYLSVFDLFLTQWIMAILFKGCKPDNFESYNFLKFMFTNIWGLRSNSRDILGLCETNLDDSVDSGHLSVRGYLPLIRKYSSTHMHGLAVYVKEWLPFARDLSLESSADSYLCFWLALLHSASYFFFLYWSPSLPLCTTFDSISSNIDEILLINPSAYVFVFGNFDIDHEDCLTYSGGADKLLKQPFSDS